MLLISQFGGIAPKVAADKLPNNLAQKALNCRFDSGSLRPIRGNVPVYALKKIGEVRTIYNTADGVWLEWLEDVDVVGSPLPNDPHDRLYWTGEGAPKMGGSERYAEGGSEGDPCPRASYPLGIPAPDPAEKITAAFGPSEMPPSDPENAVSVRYALENVALPRGTEQTWEDVLTFSTDGEVSLAGDPFFGVSSDLYGYTSPRVVITPGDEVKIVLGGPKEAPDSFYGRLASGEAYNYTSVGLAGWTPFTKRPGYYTFACSLWNDGDGNIRLADIVARRLYRQIGEGEWKFLACLSTAGQEYIDNKTELEAQISRVEIGWDPPFGGGNGYYPVPIPIFPPGGSSYQYPTSEVSFLPLPSDATNIDSVAWVYTFVSIYGEEGPPSYPSEIMDVTPGDLVLLQVPAPVSPPQNIEKKRIYRVNNGEYQLLTELGIGDTEFSDAVLPENLGGLLTTTDFDLPPSDMVGIIALPNGIMAGFSGNQVCFSEPYLPHAWPVKYRTQVFGKVVALAAFGSSLVVVHDSGPPCVMTGDHPDSMSQGYMEVGYAGVCKRGVVDMGAMAVIPTGVGLVGCGVGANSLLTAAQFGHQDWGALSPETFSAWRSGGEYVAFGEDGAIIFNPETGDCSTLDLIATAGRTDQANGKLYLAIDGQVWLFNSRIADPANMEWRSKAFETPPVNFSVLVAKGASYPFEVDIFADGAKVVTKVVTSGNPMRLPSGFRATSWEIEVRGDKEVSLIAMATSMRELRGI